ncbi:unnamed protein product [Leuciscus chuanchicus]
MMNTCPPNPREKEFEASSSRRSNSRESLLQQCPLTTPHVDIAGRCGPPSAQAGTTPECHYRSRDSRS